jgi:hypothetical protein
MKRHDFALGRGLFINYSLTIIMHLYLLLYIMFITKTHAIMFPCAKFILWIARNVDMETRYISSARVHPITFFDAYIIDSYYT